VRPVRDTDHSRPSSAEVKNKYKLYILSPLGPTLRRGTDLLSLAYINTYTTPLFIVVFVAVVVF
jgi:hypothetical protein